LRFFDHFECFGLFLELAEDGDLVQGLAESIIGGEGGAFCGDKESGGSLVVFGEEFFESDGFVEGGGVHAGGGTAEFGGFFIGFFFTPLEGGHTESFVGFFALHGGVLFVSSEGAVERIANDDSHPRDDGHRHVAGF